MHSTQGKESNKEINRANSIGLKTYSNMKHYYCFWTGNFSIITYVQSICWKCTGKLQAEYCLAGKRQVFSLDVKIGRVEADLMSSGSLFQLWEA